MLSAIVPGAGQLYTGAGYNGLNALLFNLLTGGTAYTAWNYELSKDKENRNFVLPFAASAAFSLFYISNLYNTINSVNRANNVSQKNYYEKILSDFGLVINKQSIFINFSY